MTTWRDLVQQVNSYQLKPDEKSVLVRVVGGVGVGRLLAQMGELKREKKMKHFEKNGYRGRAKSIVKAKRVSGESVSSSRLMYYNLTIGKKRVRMSIEKELYITKEIIDKAMAQLNKNVTFIHIEGANWGALSEVVEDRTMSDMSRSLAFRLISEKADYSSFQYFLNHEKVVAYIVNGAVSNSLGIHEKIVPIPLGISVNHSSFLFDSVDSLRSRKIVKQKLLVVNTHPTPTRAPLIAELKNKLHSGDIDISYDVHVPHSFLYAKVSEAKFVFCPSGLGFDTFRLWESLVLGAIPIVESNPSGLDRTYGSLPVLVVRNFADVTEDLLRRSYICFQKNAMQYKYQHLTVKYWVDMIKDIQKVASSAPYNIEHPLHNEYCNFL